MFQHLGTFLGFACLIASCLPSTPASTDSRNAPELTPQPSPSEGDFQTDRACDLRGPWRLRLETSGGLAGVHRVLEVASDGSLEFAERPEGTRLRGELPSSSLSNLVEQLEAACPALRSGPARSQCADCFIHVLVLEADSGRIRWHADSSAEIDESIIGVLSTLQEIEDPLRESGNGS